MIRLGGLVKTLRESFGRAEFITDFGKDLIGTNNLTGEKIIVPRYAVWGDKGKGKPEVIETSSDLNYLFKKYELSEKNIALLPKIK